MAVDNCAVGFHLCYDVLPFYRSSSPQAMGFLLSQEQVCQGRWIADELQPTFHVYRPCRYTIEQGHGFARHLVRSRGSGHRHLRLRHEKEITTRKAYCFR